MCPFCFYFCMQIMLKTDMENKKSLVGAWVEAARPRTLPASVSPVCWDAALPTMTGVRCRAGSIVPPWWLSSPR